MSSNELTSIQTYQDLISEKARLEKLIENQKNIIRHDLDELKAEFKKEIKPAIDAANFVKKIARPETRSETILTVGAGLLLDFTLKRVLRNSNILLQVAIPRILKNYTTHFFHSLKKKPATVSSQKQFREIL
jgi:hypothetical protein